MNRFYMFEVDGDKITQGICSDSVSIRKTEPTLTTVCENEISPDNYHYVVEMLNGFTGTTDIANFPLEDLAKISKYCKTASYKNLVAKISKAEDEFNSKCQRLFMLKSDIEKLQQQVDRYEKLVEEIFYECPGIVAEDMKNKGEFSVAVDILKRKDEIMNSKASLHVVLSPVRQYKNGTDIGDGYVDKCPICGRVFVDRVIDKKSAYSKVCRLESFCQGCGQKIDWSDN